MSTVEAQVQPLPLVKLTARPIQWLRNKILLVVAALVLAYLGMLAAAGTYYLLFEVNPTMTALWHRAVSDPNLRHSIRNIGEGLYGGLFAQAVVWNHFKKRKLERKRLDNLEIKLHISNLKDDKPLSVLQLLATPFLVLLYAAPGFLLAFYVVLPVLHPVLRAFGEVASIFQPALVSNVPTPSASGFSKFQALLTSDVDKKLLGYGASLFFGRRVVKGVFDDLQLWFVERRIRSGKSVSRWYPAPYQARYNVVKEQTSTHGLGVIEHDESATLVFVKLAAGLTMLGLVLTGLYVLIFIAS